MWGEYEAAKSRYVLVGITRSVDCPRGGVHLPCIYPAYGPGVDIFQPMYTYSVVLVTVHADVMQLIALFGMLNKND